MHVLYQTSIEKYFLNHPRVGQQHGRREGWSRFHDTQCSSFNLCAGHLKSRLPSVECYNRIVVTVCKSLTGSESTGYLLNGSTVKNIMNSQHKFQQITISLRAYATNLMNIYIYMRVCTCSCVCCVCLSQVLPPNSCFVTYKYVMHDYMIHFIFHSFHLLSIFTKSIAARGFSVRWSRWDN